VLRKEGEPSSITFCFGLTNTITYKITKMMPSKFSFGWPVFQKISHIFNAVDRPRDAVL